jgi:hypothetical protein
MSDKLNPYARVGLIPLPPGYHRLPVSHDPFTAWLRALPLKKDRTVYLYDGSPKRNQDAQYAVLDISVGKADLQQCADAVMRLRAEYLFATHDRINIDFYTEQGTRLNFLEWACGGRVRLDKDRLVRYTLQTPDHFDDSRFSFDNYLTTVFTWCGTHTLEKQLISKNIETINGGDVLIKGGAPGHAMIVVDVAEDDKGRRIFLLAQSYMPAQDIHIVKNPNDARISPWYTAYSTRGMVETPEWTFTTSQLRTWPRGIPHL